MRLAGELSQLDRFDAEWQAIERREKSTLKELKSIATVRSVGASTRIEGSHLSDKEVEVLIENLDISSLSERDEQEVAGYYETLNLLSESYRDIPVTENSIRHLHNTLMKYSFKDGYHKGNYKTHSNRVERTEADGSKTSIFETTPPGWPTEDAMRQLVNWYNEDAETHALIRAAVFVYEFLSIHPFQDGNGRLSRLLATFLLMKSGYRWIEYVSFEHEIEHRKKEYYKNLMEAQRNRPGEDVTNWVTFFLDCLKNLQTQLREKISEKKQREAIGIREQRVYTIIEHNPGISSGEIARKLGIPNPTVKRIVGDMAKSGVIIQHGVGRGTRYSIATGSIRHDIGIRLTNEERIKDFTLQQAGAFLRIKKIVLTPLFAWKHPDEWSRKLTQNGLYFTMRCITSKGTVFEQHYDISSYNNPTYFHPVFVIAPHIVLPDQLKSNQLFKVDYPVKGTITLSGSADRFDFDVMLVTDEG